MNEAIKNDQKTVITVECQAKQDQNHQSIAVAPSSVTFNMNLNETYIIAYANHNKDALSAEKQNRSFWQKIFNTSIWKTSDGIDHDPHKTLSKGAKCQFCTFEK